MSLNDDRLWVLSVSITLDDSEVHNLTPTHRYLPGDSPSSGSVSQSAPGEPISHRGVRAETAKLKSVTAVLHQHPNGLVFILKLPDEVLQDIFHYVVDVEDVKFSIKPAIILGVVCRRWRRVVLATSTLWGRINQDEPSWMPCALERSRSTPLFISWSYESLENDGGTSVHLDGRRATPSRFDLPLLIADMHRVKVLELTHGKDAVDWIQTLQDLLLQPSPMLQVLDINAGTLRCHLLEEAARKCPNLQILTTYEVVVPWTACARSWKNLVYLDVGYAEGARRDKLTLGDVIQIFTEMTLLVNVRFERCLGELESADALSNSEVEDLVSGGNTNSSPEGRLMPRFLRNFECNCISARSAFELWRHLELPASCTVICDCNHAANASAFHILGCISLLTGGRFATGVRLGGSTAIRIKIYYDHSDSLFKSSIAFRCAGTPRLLSDIVATHIWRLRSFQKIVLLQLAIRSKDSAIVWVDIAQRCTALLHLNLRSAASAASFLAALQDPDIPIPPSLQNIHVSNECKLSLSEVDVWRLAMWRRHSLDNSLEMLVFAGRAYYDCSLDHDPTL